MNKEQFVEILQSALLTFDGVQEPELIQEYGLNPELAKIGVHLCSYLKNKEINLQNNEKGGEKITQGQKIRQNL